MKISYIMPGKYSQEYRTAKGVYLSQYTSPGTQLDVSITGGTQDVSLTGAVDLAMIAPLTVKKTIQAERDGYDAVILGAT